MSNVRRFNRQLWMPSVEEGKGKVYIRRARGNSVDDFNNVQGLINGNGISIPDELVPNFSLERCFIAYNNDIPVAAAVTGLINKGITIDAISVIPKYGNKKFASFLLARIIFFAYNEGARDIYARVPKYLVQAAGRFGFNIANNSLPNMPDFVLMSARPKQVLTSVFGLPRLLV